MATYEIKYTDVSKPPIDIDQGDLNIDTTSVALFGRIKLEYGDLLNEDLLHLLENFACPESSTIPGTPDLDVALEHTLSQPTEGQLWFNTTQNSPFVWDNNSWRPLGSTSDYGANWGRIYHGQQIPLPVSQSGYEFSYSECVWVLSPSEIDLSTSNGFSYMVCTADSNGVVDHRYSRADDNGIVEGLANYMIIGIKGNNNLGTHIEPPPPPPFNTSIPMVTPTSTPAPSVTPSPTRAPTVTPTPSPFAPISAWIYIAPSLGTQSSFGAAEAQLTNCNRNAYSDYDGCEKSLSVWVADIFGGVGSTYTIDWNLHYFYVCQFIYLTGGNNGSPVRNAYIPATDPPVNGTGLFPWEASSFTGNTSGYTCVVGGSTANIPGGSGVRATAYCRSNYTPQFESGSRAVGYSVSMTLLSGSTVTISDGHGNSTVYYTPGGSEGNVLRSRLISPPATNYTDTYDIILQT